MFIRKRVQKLKNGKIWVTYQAVESYRIGKKVKQRIVSLGQNFNPKEVLREELRFMKNAEKNYRFPLSKWEEVRFSPGGSPYRVKMSEKQARKRREFWRKIYDKCLEKVGKVESVVSKYPTIKYADDTTLLKKRDKKKEAEDNLQELRTFIDEISKE